MLGSAERQQGHRRRHADRRHAAGNKDCHGRDHLASGVSAWTCPRGMAQDSAVRPASRGWLTWPSPPAAAGAATPRCRRRSPRAYRALPESVPDTNGSSPSRSLTSWKAALRGVSGRTGRNAQQAAPPTAPRAFSASTKMASRLNRAARGRKTEMGRARGNEFGLVTFPWPGPGADSVIDFAPAMLRARAEHGAEPYMQPRRPAEPVH